MIIIIRVAGWICVALLAMLLLPSAEGMVRTGVGGHAEHALAYAGMALLQGLSPGRHPTLADRAASSAGALTGLEQYSPSLRYGQRRVR